ncbi:hypothetical protein AAC387_Pa03g0722 [Persea americana]
MDLLSSLSNPPNQMAIFVPFTHHHRHLPFTFLRNSLTHPSHLFTFKPTQPNLHLHPFSLTKPHHHYHLSTSPFHHPLQLTDPSISSLYSLIHPTKQPSSSLSLTIITIFHHFISTSKPIYTATPSSQITHHTHDPSCLFSIFITHKDHRHPQPSLTTVNLKAKQTQISDGDIMSNSFKAYQRRKHRVADQTMMWMDDVYHDFTRQDVINPPLDYHYDDIRWLDFGRSTI